MLKTSCHVFPRALGLATALLALPLFSWAIEPDQVRGEVVSVDEARRAITLEVLEAGDERSARVGEQATFRIPEDVDLEYQVDGSVYRPYVDDEIEIGEVAVGDRLRIDFESVGGTLESRTIRTEATTNVAVRDRVRDRGEYLGRADQADAVGGVAVDQDVVDSSDQNQYLASTDTGRYRDTLPSTASMLPALSVFGVILLGLAGLVGTRRS